ncbi:hypothetical protein cyc_01451 [Cyclospora cayetanensis]|uniref:Uncharacterized protein n=1 Tax=Cyclospora cayetanensis TaxID=88456 RepID=A0A1D3CR18_9EIME|nr:hypothetical protein cyc_01451 [Cyclospora cayetanensis]
MHVNLLGPSEGTADCGAVTVTDAAELPSCLLHDVCNNGKGNSTQLIEETALLRQALDKALQPLGIYWARDFFAQKELPHALAFLITESRMTQIAAAAVRKNAAAEGSSAYVKRTTEATETPAAIAIKRIQQQIEAFECCRHSVQQLLQYLQNQLLQQLLPLSKWGPKIQQQRRREQQQSQKIPHLEQPPGRVSEALGIVEEEIEIATMAIFGKATMGVAAAHAEAIEPQEMLSFLASVSIAVDASVSPVTFSCIPPPTSAGARRTVLLQ